MIYGIAHKKTIQITLTFSVMRFLKIATDPAIALANV